MGKIDSISPDSVLIIHFKECQSVSLQNYTKPVPFYVPPQLSLTPDKLPTGFFCLWDLIDLIQHNFCSLQSSSIIGICCKHCGFVSVREKTPLSLRGLLLSSSPRVLKIGVQFINSSCCIQKRLLE